jgi:putative membrane protein
MPSSTSQGCNRGAVSCHELARDPVLRHDQGMGFLLHWVVTAVALAVADWILPGVRISSGKALAISALVLGFMNAIVRPILVVLTLPLTVLTLGLFYLVVNGLAFALAAYLVPGFQVRSLESAILGALIVSLVSWFIGSSRSRSRK